MFLKQTRPSREEGILLDELKKLDAKWYGPRWMLNQKEWGRYTVKRRKLTEELEGIGIEVPKAVDEYWV